MPPKPDLAMYAVMLCLGAAYFFCYIRTPDLTLDATYPDLARSLVENGSYNFDFHPETMFPPGFPMILAFAEKLLGPGQSIPYHVVAIFATLALFVTYELLRRGENRAVAVAICLLLATSPSFFSFVTSMPFAEIPYFFFSWLVLFLAWKMDRSGLGWVQFFSVVLFGVALSASILIRTIGLTLLIALCLRILAPIVRNRHLVMHRLRRFVIPILLAVSVQVAWSAWATPRQITEWTLPGWPQSYASQLLIKNGNDPELGYAQLSDLPGRVVTNVTARAAEVSQLLTRRQTGTQFWSSPLIVGVILLVGAGLCSSLLRNGGELFDWYFLCHEALFLLWPWHTETRFVLPVVPLAWLYLYRGGELVFRLATRRPKLAGLCFLPFGAFLAFQSAEVAINTTTKRYQPAIAAFCWSLFALAGFAMFLFCAFKEWPHTSRWTGLWRNSYPKYKRPLQTAPVIVVGILMAYGGALQINTARYNQNPNLSQGPWSQDIEAAKWIRSHKPVELVIMARKQDLIFHYTQHKVVWFPPISDPHTLMDGIRKYNVSLIVVLATRKYTIWLPTENLCFQNLLQAYPRDFNLVYSNSAARVYEVDSTESRLADNDGLHRAQAASGRNDKLRDAGIQPR